MHKASCEKKEIVFLPKSLLHTASKISLSVQGRQSEKEIGDELDMMARKYLHRLYYHERTLK